MDLQIPSELRRNVERDRRDDALLSEAGWTIVRIWEHEEPEAAANRVQGVLASLDSG